MKTTEPTLADLLHEVATRTNGLPVRLRYLDLVAGRRRQLDDAQRLVLEGAEKDLFCRLLAEGPVRAAGIQYFAEAGRIKRRLYG